MLGLGGGGGGRLELIDEYHEVIAITELDGCLGAVLM